MRLTLPTARFAAAAALTAAALFAAGCNRHDGPGHRGLDAPPNLGGRYTDGDGVARTQVDVRGVVATGAQADGTLPGEGDLVGYEFEAFRGAEITAEVEVFDAAGPVGAAIYGPRSTVGLWDAALVDAHGRTPGLLSLTTPSLPAPGMYLVLVWTAHGTPNRDFQLRLSCKGNCGAPICPDLEPCGLVCDNGFVPDAGGCRTCACQEPPQCGEDIGDCPLGQVCGSDGRCQEAPPLPPECTADAPVCDTTNRTWPNRCSLDAAGRTFAHGGRCSGSPQAECDDARPCRTPDVCRDGQCVRPDCDCPDESAPVCSVAQHTYRNLCELECHEGAAALAYHGECVDLRPCREADDCPDGRECAPVRDPDNLARCEADPADAACQKVCVLGDSPDRCGEGGARCTAGMACYPAGDEPGVCLSVCALGGAACGDGLVCAAVAAEGAGAGQGVCLPTCRTGEGPGACPRGLRCLPDDRGQNVCQTCGCPRPEPGEEVCTDQQVEYASECFAACAHAANWRGGRCGDDAVCDCPFLWAPVCGPQGTLYNRCEARCELPPDLPVEPADACLPAAAAGYDTVCERDDDCAPTGCDGRLCAAEALPAGVCPALSDELACYAAHGRCRCVNNRCGFDPTSEVEDCVEALPKGRQPLAAGQGGGGGP